MHCLLRTTHRVVVCQVAPPLASLSICAAAATLRLTPTAECWLQRQREPLEGALKLRCLLFPCMVLRRAALCFFNHSFFLSAAASLRPRKRSATGIASGRDADGDDGDDDDDDSEYRIDREKADRTSGLLSSTAKRAASRRDGHRQHERETSDDAAVDDDDDSDLQRALQISLQEFDAAVGVSASDASASAFSTSLALPPSRTLSAGDLVEVWT